MARIPEKWTNCYEEGWKDFIVPEAFSHPAKMAYNLLSRILQHAGLMGWLTPESIILDPFGGISTTGILAAYAGYQAITCELEPKFTNLAMQNVKLHLSKWQILNCPPPIIIQGDSRRLCELVESADLVVSSLPFGDSMVEGGDPNYAHKFHGNQREYGSTPGQLGAMKPGKLDLVISSPPYGETTKGDNSEKQTKEESVQWRNTQGGSMGQSQRRQGYGSTPGNLGNLKAGDVSLILSSPPYEKQQQGGGIQKSLAGLSDYPVKDGLARTKKAGRSAKGFGYHGQGNSEGQLGQEQGDTFWQAAKEIVQQCYQILRPGGHAIFVTKDFVRKGKRVTFSDDWQKLCESIGFETVCRHQAMLVKEDVKESLFGGKITKKKERKSFFRRLAEAKGSPKIDWEDVICMTRPLFEPSEGIGQNKGEEIWQGCLKMK